jgi:hypothetical protein
MVSIAIARSGDKGISILNARCKARPCRVSTAVTTKLKITPVDSSTIASGSTIRKPVRRNYILHADKGSSRSRPASVFIDLLYCSAEHAPTYSQRVDT